MESLEIQKKHIALKSLQIQLKFEPKSWYFYNKIIPMK